MQFDKAVFKRFLKGLVAYVLAGVVVSVLEFSRLHIPELFPGFNMALVGGLILAVEKSFKNNL